MLAAAVILYLQFNDSLKAYFFIKFQKTIPSKISTSRVLFISDQFSLGDYIRFFDRMAKLENSVALLLPQVFNIKIGDYLEDISQEEIKKIQDEYKEFSIKLAEAANIIPVVFLYSSRVPEKNVDACLFTYFGTGDIKQKPVLRNMVRVKSERMWKTVPNVAFYEDYNYYPYKMPLLYRYNDCILVSAAVEGIRKYYKLNKSGIKYEAGNVLIGNVVQAPMLDSAEIIVHQVKEIPKVYSLNEALSLPDGEINDKIIIVRSLNNSEHAMVSLGVAISSLMQGVYVSYPKTVNYIASIALFMLLFAAYRFLALKYGVLIVLLTEASVVITTYLLLDKNIYINFVLLTAVNLVTFAVLYFYRGSTALIEMTERAGKVRPFMHPAAVNAFVMKNRDLKSKNTWLRAPVVYFLFDRDFSEDPGKVKITFENIRQMLYNREKEFYIRLQGGREVVTVFTGEKTQPKNILAALFDIREAYADTKFNMVLSDTEVYIYEAERELVLSDRNYELKTACERLEKKRNIIVPERNVQKYVSLARFQKISESSGEVLFNIAGSREEAVNEN
jgi:hypothetical protein